MDLKTAVEIGMSVKVDKIGMKSPAGSTTLGEIIDALEIMAKHLSISQPAIEVNPGCEHCYKIGECSPINFCFNCGRDIRTA